MEQLAIKKTRSTSILFLSFYFLFITGFSSDAYAALPTLCLGSPLGFELYVSGETQTIEYHSPDYDPADPDHSAVTLAFLYKWLPDGALTFIHEVALWDEMSHGDFTWTVPSPPSATDEGFLRVYAQYLLKNMKTPIAVS